MEGLPEPYSYNWWKELLIGVGIVFASVWGTIKWANRKQTGLAQALNNINTSLGDHNRRLLELEAERTMPRPFCHQQKEHILQTAKSEVQRELSLHQESISDLKDTINEHIKVMGSTNLSLALVTQSVKMIETTISEDIKLEIKSINRRLDRRSNDPDYVDPFFARRQSDPHEG
jgi:chromosome segregation ATPase